jgi:hypothetical protein
METVSPTLFANILRAVNLATLSKFRFVVIFLSYLQDLACVHTERQV